MLHSHNGVDDLYIFRNIKQDTMLRMHHDILTRVDNSLDPEIGFVIFLTHHIIFMSGLEPMMSVQDIQCIYLFKLQ